MAFKIGNREQQTFFLPVIDDYISSQDPVRVYNAFVDALDFHQLGISLIPKAGAERYEPVRMLKLIFIVILMACAALVLSKELVIIIYRISGLWETQSRIIEQSRVFAVSIKMLSKKSLNNACVCASIWV